jgi:hypothetical protein
MTTFTSNRKERLRLDGQAALSRARALADTAKSEGRGLTTSEQSAYDEAIAKGRTAADGLRKMAGDAELLSYTRELGADLGLTGTKSGQRLSFGKAMASEVATKMLGEYGSKALAPSGSTVVGQEFKPDRRTGPARQQPAECVASCDARNS